MSNRALSNEQAIRQLQWRYAVKKFDPSRKISAEDWATLEHALVLAPSSFGLQPWKFWVVRDAATRQKLRPVSHNQAQIVDASHLVVFTARKGLNAEDVKKYVARISHVRGMPAEALKEFEGKMIEHLKSPELDAWAKRQVYIPLGVFLATAAYLGIDACPMEGFDPAGYDRILGIDEAGYSAVALATAGYRAADDGYGKLAKVRFKPEDVIVHVG
jgi:nitroreductase